jgi:hypothetical protein
MSRAIHRLPFRCALFVTLIATWMSAMPLWADTLPVTLVAQVEHAETHGIMVRGRLRLTVVNVSGDAVNALTLKIADGALGKLGDDGSVTFRDLGIGETGVVIAQFVLADQALRSSAPILIEASYTNAAGTAQRAALSMRVTGGAQ